MFVVYVYFIRYFSLKTCLHTHTPFTNVAFVHLDLYEQGRKWSIQNPGLETRSDHTFIFKNIKIDLHIIHDIFYVSYFRSAYLKLYNLIFGF